MRLTVVAFGMQGGAPVVATGLLQHEAKLTVLNFAVKKVAGYQESLPSKTELLLVSGVRWVSPPGACLLGKTGLYLTKGSTRHLVRVSLSYIHVAWISGSLQLLVVAQPVPKLMTSVVSFRS